MSALLTATDVKVHFGGVKAVDGITLELQPGKLHGVVGPNGSGKTTLINAISRFVPLTAGTITSTATPWRTCTRTRSAGPGWRGRSSRSGCCRR